MANTASMANMIKVADVTRAYRGRIGCTCGCRGKHFEPGSKGLAGVVRDLNARISEAYRYKADGEKHAAIWSDGKCMIVSLRPSANVAFLPDYDAEQRREERARKARETAARKAAR